jgi:hypothetical protein
MRRCAFPAAIVALVIIHVGLIFYFERPSVIFSGEPNSWLDFDTHIEQAWKALEAMDKWGKSWSYDPYLLAGNPNGTLFAADNKGWELWTFALWKLGVQKGIAFNLFLILAHVMVPWAAFFSVRLFGLGKWASLIAAVMGLSIWYFDSAPRWGWWCGMIAYGMASYLSILTIALFYRYLKGGRVSHLILLAVTMSVQHLIHPYAFVILVVPMLILYIQAAKKIPMLRHLGTVGAALIVVASNLYWIVPMIKFAHYLMPLESGTYGQSSPLFLLTDYLGLLNEPVATGVLSTRTGFRFIVLAAAAAALISWRKSSDDRFKPLAAGILSMLAIAYLGSYTIIFTYLQPYRHVLPAIYLSIIPAAAFFETAVGSGALRRLPRLAYAIGGLGLLAIGGNLARDVLYFFPGALPNPHLGPADLIELKIVNPYVPDIGSRQMEFRHVPPFEDYAAVVSWINENDDGRGRILVQAWVLGEHLAWRTDSQILGGFRFRGMEHSQANLFHRMDRRKIDDEEIGRYLEDYAVKWMVVSGPVNPLEKKTEFFNFAGYIPPVHRMYETTVTPSYFAEGGGSVSATLNRIQVTGADPGEDVVLRFHWLETLICRPGCSLFKEPIEHDSVGFIRIPAPHPADFDIENGY